MPKKETQLLKFARIQSPSSINTYKQCPRKYYYSYIKKLQTLPSIHLIRGKIVHSVLEDFFKLNVDHISEETYDFELKVILNEIFKKHWSTNRSSLSLLNLSEAELKHYHDESKVMVNNFHSMFMNKLKPFQTRFYLSFCRIKNIGLFLNSFFR